MLLKLLPLALFATLAAFLWKGLALDPGKLPSPLIDRPAPVFTVATLRRGENGSAPSAVAVEVDETDGEALAATPETGEPSASGVTPDGAGRADADGANAAGTAGSDPGAVFDSAAMAGRVWVLNIWASWCGPCLQEHPQLVALAGSRDVPIVGLNYKDDPRAARAWLDRHGDIFSDVLADIDGSVGLDWGVYGVPETFVIDAEGQVRFKHVGPVMPDDLEGRLLPIIDELQGSPS